MELKILSVLLLFWTSQAQSAAHDRVTRSLSFLPSFFGGSTNPAADSHAAETTSSPATFERHQNYPIWRVHRYNGINLRPVSETSLQNQRASAVSNYGVRSTAHRVHPNEIPNDLRVLAQNLGFTNFDNFPSLDAIASMLGTSSSEETVSFIRDLAKTWEGLNLIREFLARLQQSKPEQGEEQLSSIEANFPTFVSNTNNTPRIVQTNTPVYTSALPPTHSNLIAVFSAPKPDVSSNVVHFEGFQSAQLQGIKPSGQEGPFLISFRQPSQQVDQTHILTGLPSVNQLPPIRGLESLPTVGDVTGQQYFVPSTVRRPSIGSPLFRAPASSHTNRPIYFLRPSWIPPALTPHQLGSISIAAAAANRPAQLPTNVGSNFETIIGSASEQQAVNILPPVSAFALGDRSDADGHALQGDISSDGNQAENVPTSALGRPQRVSGVEEEAYATGKIHTADMSAIDFPITTINNSARSYGVDQLRENAEEERAFIESLAKLTSAH